MIGIAPEIRQKIRIITRWLRLWMRRSGRSSAKQQLSESYPTGWLLPCAPSTPSSDIGCGGRRPSARRVAAERLRGQETQKELAADPSRSNNRSPPPNGHPEKDRQTDRGVALNPPDRSATLPVRKCTRTGCQLALRIVATVALMPSWASKSPS